MKFIDFAKKRVQFTLNENNLKKECLKKGNKKIEFFLLKATVILLNIFLFLII